MGYSELKKWEDKINAQKEKYGVWYELYVLGNEEVDEMTHQVCTKNGQSYLSSCINCFKGKFTVLPSEFASFGAIPKCISDLENYNEKKSLALGAFFCRTFHPGKMRATFAHTGGFLNWGMSVTVIIVTFFKEIDLISSGVCMES
jgi:hypothetical protein